MLNLGGLKCPYCNDDLELDVRFDGLSEKAKQFSSDNKDWGWVVYLDCMFCGRVYPICRTPDRQFISDIIDFSLPKKEDDCSLR